MDKEFIVACYKLYNSYNYNEYPVITEEDIKEYEIKAVSCYLKNMHFNARVKRLFAIAQRSDLEKKENYK